MRGLAISFPLKMDIIDTFGAMSAITSLMDGIFSSSPIRHALGFAAPAADGFQVPAT
ncbi:hypothetical protein [Agrobacterium vitis]